MSRERGSPVGELSGEQPTHYLRPQRKPEVRRRAVWRTGLRWTPRVLLILIPALALSWVGYRGYGYARGSPRFRLASLTAVELVNLRYASPATVRECFAADAGRSVFGVPLEARRRALEEIPWIAKARVQRLVPNRLRVVVEERTPVAFLRQGNALMLVDAAGVLLERSAGASFTFPVLTGFAPGLTLEERRARVELYLEFLRDLDASGQAYSAEVSEVDLADLEDLRGTVTQKGQAVVLHFGRDRYREKYEAYRKHRPLWQKSGETVHVVDLRYRGQLVLNPDPAPPAGARFK